MPFSDEGLVRLAASCQTPIVSAIGHEQDAPLLDLVADVRASTPTDAAKKVVPDIAQELAMIQQLRERTYRRLTTLVNFEIERIATLRQRPVLKDPSVLVTSRLEIIQGLRDRSQRSTANAINMVREELLHLLARVRSLSPQSTLDRGYAVVQKADGTVARDPGQLQFGEKLRLRLARGDAHATVSESGE